MQRGRPPRTAPPEMPSAGETTPSAPDMEEIKGTSSEPSAPELSPGEMEEQEGLRGARAKRGGGDSEEQKQRSLSFSSLINQLNLLYRQAGQAGYLPKKEEERKLNIENQIKEYIREGVDLNACLEQIKKIKIEKILDPTRLFLISALPQDMWIDEKFDSTSLSSASSTPHIRDFLKDARKLVTSRFSSADEKELNETINYFKKYSDDPRCALIIRNQARSIQVLGLGRLIELAQQKNPPGNITDHLKEIIKLYGDILTDVTPPPLSVPLCCRLIELSAFNIKIQIDLIKMLCFFKGNKLNQDPEKKQIRSILAKLEEWEQTPGHPMDRAQRTEEDKAALKRFDYHFYLLYEKIHPTPFDFEDPNDRSDDLTGSRRNLRFAANEYVYDTRDKSNYREKIEALSHLIHMEKIKFYSPEKESDKWITNLDRIQSTKISQAFTLFCKTYSHWGQAIRISFARKDVSLLKEILNYLKEKESYYFGKEMRSYEEEIKKVRVMAGDAINFLSGRGNEPLAKQLYLPAVYALAKEHMDANHVRRALFLSALILLMTKKEGQEKVNYYGFDVNLSKEEIAEMRKKAQRFILDQFNHKEYWSLAQFYMKLLDHTNKDETIQHPALYLYNAGKDAYNVSRDGTAPKWLESFFSQKIKRNLEYFRSYIAHNIQEGMAESLYGKIRFWEPSFSVNHLPLEETPAYSWVSHKKNEEKKEEQQPLDEATELTHITEELVSIDDEKQIGPALQFYYRGLAILMNEPEEDPSQLISSYVENLKELKEKFTLSSTDEIDEAIKQGENILHGQDVSSLYDLVKQYTQQSESAPSEDSLISALHLYTKIVLLLQSQNKAVQKLKRGEIVKMRTEALAFINSISNINEYEKSVISFAKNCQTLIEKAKDKRIANPDGYLLKAYGLGNNSDLYPLKILWSMQETLKIGSDLFNQINRVIINNREISPEVKQEEVKEMGASTVAPSAPPQQLDEIVVPPPAAVKYQLPNEIEGEQEVEEVKVPEQGPLEEPEGVIEEEQPGMEEEEPESPRPEGVEESAQPFVVSKQVGGFVFVGEEEKKPSVQQPEPVVVRQQAPQALFTPPPQQESKKEPQNLEDLLDSAPHAPQERLDGKKEKLKHGNGKVIIKK